MFKLGCRDMGIDCDFVAEGATKEEVIAKGMAHGAEVHGMKPEDMTAEKSAAAMAAIKEVS